MTNKYKLPLTVILIFLIVTLMLCVGYYIHKQNVINNSAEVIIDEELSINYLNERKINSNDKEIKINFSIINDSDDEIMYHINLEDISLEGKNVTYTLSENNNSLIKSEELAGGKNITVSSFINISGNNKKTYELTIKNPDKAKVSFNLNVLKVSKEDPNFSQIILNNNTIKKEAKTKVGEEISVVDEGLISDIDDNGNTYYFRGNVSNNNVKFANYLWKIVRINGDGTVKLVLNSSIIGSAVYSSKENLESLEKIFNNNYYLVLNEWYNQNLKDYDKYISQSKYCIDINKEGENLSNYFRINISNTPTFNCLGKKNNSKIGLLTIDEIIYAGATINEPNEYYYLNNNEINESWWSMSPAKEGIEGTYFYEVTANGSVLANSTGEAEKKLRPVINLIKEVEVSGTGTIDDPYILK